MLMLFMYCCGAAAVLIQYISAEKAFSGGNYWEIKKTLIDVLIDGIVFVLALTGGVGGFYIAIISSLTITIYLNYFKKHDINKPEPRLWVWLRERVFKKINM